MEKPHSIETRVDRITGAWARTRERLMEENERSRKERPVETIYHWTEKKER